jgi:hypothetical protein
MDFIYCYTFIEDSTLEIDDEILNWTLPDVADDLASSIFAAASAFYKPAMSMARSAYEMCAVSLAFQIEENLNPRPGEYCSELFARWDRGDMDTPNWKFIKSKLRERTGFAQYQLFSGIDVIDAHIYQHYQELCAFTHARPYSKKNGEPTNTTNMATDGFDALTLKRVLELIDETVSWSATMWILGFPQILTAAARQSLDPDPLFTTGESCRVLQFLRC